MYTYMYVEGGQCEKQFIQHVTGEVMQTMAECTSAEDGHVPAPHCLFNFLRPQAQSSALLYAHSIPCPEFLLEIPSREAKLTELT